MSKKAKVWDIEDTPDGPTVESLLSYFRRDLERLYGAAEGLNNGQLMARVCGMQSNLKKLEELLATRDV